VLTDLVWLTRCLTQGTPRVTSHIAILHRNILLSRFWLKSKMNQSKETWLPPITTCCNQYRLPLKPLSIIYTLITLVNMTACKVPMYIFMVSAIIFYFSASHCNVNIAERWPITFHKKEKKYHGNLQFGNA